MGAHLSLQGLRKDFGSFTAVDGIDLEIEAGAFAGLLGPNGAGKSTTIGMISGLVHPTGGKVLIGGVDAWKDPLAARRKVGLCPQELNFDDFLGLEKILAFHGGYFGMPFGKALDRARELLKFMDLYEKRTQRTSTLSGGMKRRLLLARALMHDPELLILDEPTAGVDVELRRSLWEYVQQLNDDGTTVLLTTHYLEEAEALCNDVAVIDQGRIIEQDSPDALRDKYGHRRVVIELDGAPEAFDACGFERSGNRFVLEGKDTTDAMRCLLRQADQANLVVLDMEVSRSRLEDVFVSLTHKEAEA